MCHNNQLAHSPSGEATSYSANQEIHEFLQNPKFHYWCHKSLILIQYTFSHPAKHPLWFYPPRLCLGLPSGALPFTPKFSSQHCTCTAYFVILNFYRPNCTWCVIQIISKHFWTKVYLQKTNVFTNFSVSPCIFQFNNW